MQSIDWPDGHKKMPLFLCLTNTTRLSRQLTIMLVFLLLIFPVFTGSAEGGQGQTIVLKLKAPKNRILAARNIDWLVENPDGTWENKGQLKKYLYATDMIVGPATHRGLHEDISKRTKNAQFFPAANLNFGSGQWIAKVYSGEPFYFDPSDHKWYQTAWGLTTIEVFNKQTKITLWDGFKELLFGRSAFADTGVVYSGAGDGMIQSYTVTNYIGGQLAWDEAHDQSSGLLASTYDIINEQDDVVITQTKHSGYWRTSFRRAFFPIDTTGLDDSMSIVGASFFAYVTGTTNGEQDGTDYIGMVETAQAVEDFLNDDDYDQCGAIDDPVQGATALNIAGITAGAYNEWVLNATGLTWINKAGYTKLGLREGHDIEDEIFDTWGYNYTKNSIGARFSEYEGVFYDPYLEIIYTANGGGNKPEVKDNPGFTNLKNIMTNGAGKSSQVPKGLLSAPGIQKFIQGN